MVIKKSKRYKQDLQNILTYIAKDKVSAMLHFRKELNLQLEQIVNMPYKYRQSIYYSNENSRDMTFKGYTIIYEIKEETIVVKTIFNKNLPSVLKGVIDE